MRLTFSRWVSNLGCGDGAIAQLGERVVRNDEVVGSIPSGSTIYLSHRERAALSGTIATSPHIVTVIQCT